jgi:hypothetical protein
MSTKTKTMTLGLVSALLCATSTVAGAASQTVDVYGAWHCGNDYCTWSTVRSSAEFDAKNHWLIDRGNDIPSVNLVVLAFVHPLQLLNKTTETAPLDGLPVGMTSDIVRYFTEHGVRVMLSIGGITYTTAWNQALAQDAAKLGRNAALAARALGVGIEIDYEENKSPNLAGLEQFIRAYRAVLPYDASGTDPAARLTIDLAAGDRWLIAITRKATTDWLRDTSSAAVRLDYANAMVPARQPSARDAIANWQEHADGKPQYAPPIPPLAPAKFTGSVYLVGSKVVPECNRFTSSLQSSTSSFVRSVAGKEASMTSGMLGYMFWAAECSGTRSVCTTPPTTCEGGVGAGATSLGVPVPMPTLRQY